MTQHSTLTGERWAQFTLAQQILMIANEMQRIATALAGSFEDRRRNGYERVLRLVDLTIACQRGPALRKELLRWRDVIAALYVAPGGDPVAHSDAFRCLLYFTPESAKQIPFVTLTR